MHNWPSVSFSCYIEELHVLNVRMTNLLLLCPNNNCKNIVFNKQIIILILIQIEYMIKVKQKLKQNLKA